MYRDIENPWKTFAQEVGGNYRLTEEGTWGDSMILW